MEGTISHSSMASFTTEPDNPTIKLIEQYMTAKGKKPEERVWTCPLSWAMCHTILDCVEKGVARVGWKNMDGGVIKEEMLKLKDYDAWKICKYTFTEDIRSPRATRISVVRNGKIEYLTGEWVQTPDLRPYELRGK